MGQKVHPYGIRLGITTDWKSAWFFEKDYKDLLVEDLRLRKFIADYCDGQNISGLANVEIRRKVPTEVWLTIQTARPGLLIGRQGKGIEVLRRALEDLTKRQVHINVEEVKDPRLDAKLTAESIAQQIERRASLRRAVTRAIQETMRAGAKGIKVTCSGRFAGAEIARTETHKEGRIPLSTFRADVDYGIVEAKTAYGNIGVKVWICRDDGKEIPAPTVAKGSFGRAA